MERSAHGFLVFATTVLLLASATPAGATPITYEISGISSGAIGGIPFTNAWVTVTLTSDTSTVVAAPLGADRPDVVANRGTTTVNIPGVGIATVTDATAVFASVTPVAVPGGSSMQPLVIIATLDNPPSLQSITAIGLLAGNALLGYDLRAPSSPGVQLGGVGRDSSEFANTTLGKLTFSVTATPPTNQVTFIAAAQITPQAGLWWNPDESGSGYALDYKHGVLVVTIYSYVSAGDPIWYLAAGPVSGSNFFSATLDRYRGGQCISCAYAGRPTSPGNDGTVTIQFTSPASATMTLPGGRVVPIQPQPF